MVADALPTPSVPRTCVARDGADSESAGAVPAGPAHQPDEAAPPGPLESGHGVRLAEVYSEHFPFVWRCLKNLGVTDVTLDDAVQEVFLVVDRKLGACCGPLRPWLFTIVRNIALRHRRRASKEAARFLHAPGDEAPCADPGDDPHQCAERRESLALAAQALACLDEAKREVFVFCQIEGFSAPEVAEIVGAPLNTVYSRLRSARREFSAHVLRMNSEARSSLAHPARPQPAPRRSS